MTQVFQSGCSFDNNGVSIGRCILPDSVPAGKRLVLETVTGAYYGDGAYLGAAYFTIGQVQYAFPWIQCTNPGANPSDRRFYGFNNYVRLYIDGPAQLQFDADGASFFAGTESFNGFYGVSGHLEDI